MNLEKLEQIQRRARRKTKGLNIKSYEDGFKKLGILSHEKRWLRDNKIALFKNLNRYYIEGQNLFFPPWKNDLNYRINQILTECYKKNFLTVTSVQQGSN